MPLKTPNYVKSAYQLIVSTLIEKYNENTVDSLRAAIFFSTVTRGWASGVLASLR